MCDEELNTITSTSILLKYQDMFALKANVAHLFDEWAYLICFGLRIGGWEVQTPYHMKNVGGRIH